MTENDPEDDEVIFVSLGDDFLEGGLSHDGDSYLEDISFNFEDRFSFDFVALFGREQKVWSDFSGFLPLQPTGGKT